LTASLRCFTISDQYQSVTDGKGGIDDEEAKAVIKLWVKRIGGCWLVRLRQPGKSAAATLDRRKFESFCRKFRNGK
jgi:hypothetical protein